MSLTPAQLALRPTGLGASDAAAVLEISPWRSPLDVYVAKKFPELDTVSNDAVDVGNAVEPGLRALASERLGLRFRRSTTLRHRTAPHVFATPDGLAVGARDGLEIKVVGAQLAHHWNGEPPDYVRVQCVQNMAVTGRERWHVVALVGGTDPRFYVVERDEDEVGALVDAMEAWWHAHIEADEPPEPTSLEERRRLIDARYPHPDAGKLVVRDDSFEVAEAMRWYATAKAIGAALETAGGVLEAMLLERVGSRYGIEGAAGRLVWFEQAGRVDWKRLALDLGASDAQADSYRGPSFRVPRFTPKKTETTRRLSR